MKTLAFLALCACSLSTMAQDRLIYYTGQHVYEVAPASNCNWDTKPKDSDCLNTVYAVSPSNYFPTFLPDYAYTGFETVYFVDSDMEWYFSKCAVLFSSNPYTFACKENSDELLVANFE